MKENQNFVQRFELGKMYMFMYDRPKGKDKLPYYDYFPLTICVKRYPTGFMGVNLHYLAPRYRHYLWMVYMNSLMIVGKTMHSELDILLLEVLVG